MREYEGSPELVRQVLLRDAALDLYRAGHWTCDRPVDEARLWEALRDALGLPPGTAPVPTAVPAKLDKQDTAC